jgi:DNA-binding CsgD family transcriptional regulator
VPIDTTAVLARESVEKIGQAALAPADFLHEVSARVARVVPHAAAAWMAIDPDTFLSSGALSGNGTDTLARALWRNELLDQDVLKVERLAGARTPVATLSELDEEALADSPRVQSIIRPAGLGDELRVVFRANGSSWGYATIFRELGDPHFTGDERAFIAEISNQIADGLRRSLRRPPEASDSGAIVPGVVAFDCEGAIVSMTAGANRLIASMPDDAEVTLFTVAIRAGRDEPARARVRLNDGRWLLLHGGRMHGGENCAHPPRVMVTLTPAPRGEIASLLLRLHGLSAREREVAQLLMAGLATDEIAERLYISRHTLRDHIKAIFAKVGASSRSELMTLATEHSE